MKKFCALLLVVLLLAAAMPVAMAENTTTITTTVPDATYTLNIPADQKINYGATSTDIGTLTVTDATGFAVGKNLVVTATYGGFVSDEVDTTIPVSLMGYYKSWGTRSISSGDKLYFKGKSDGSVELPEYSAYPLSKLCLEVTSENWGKAKSGDYSCVITFTAEVVRGS